MGKGDWKSKLQFRCAFGHTFEASPRLVLEGGHWCDECERRSWNYGKRAQVDPFFAQVWNPLHEPDELREYPKQVTELDAYDGGFCYVGAVAAFDMASTLRNVHVENVNIQVETTEATAAHRDTAYVSVAGLEAGGWAGTVDQCSVSGTISLNVTTEKSHGGTVYLGGLIAESYAYITGCKANDLKLTLNHQDISQKAEDEALTVNVGGL